jgi:hypothetical protein
MQYDECLREGYPIASGVIEGVCRHVVGDRLDRTGTRWTVDGAVAMLATRTTYLSDDWNDYQQFRINREQTRLHQTLKTWPRQASYDLLPVMTGSTVATVPTRSRGLAATTL